MKSDFHQKLMKIVIPITFQNFLLALIPVSDTVMLATLDQNAMSAVSLASRVSFVLDLFIITITSGASMFAAQFWGIHDKRSIEELYAYCMKLMAPIAFAFFFANFFFPHAIMRIFTPVPEIIEYGAGYLRVVSFSYILKSFMVITETIMKNTELVKPVTIISSAMVVVNILLNAIFIYGLLGVPKLEAIGAGIATTISGGIGLLAVIIVELKSGNVKFSFAKLFTIRKEIRSDFIKYTAPVLGNQLSWGIGFTMLSVIMGHLGGDAIAANSVVSVVKDLISCFAFALASGGAILIGNELGAGKLELAKNYGSKLCKLGIWSGVAAGILMTALAPLIINVLDLTDTAKKYLLAMLIMSVYYMVGRTMNCVTIAGIFCAGGDTTFGFICDTVTMWCFIVPVGFLAAFVFKLPVLVVYFLLNLDEMVKLPVVYRHYKKYRWVKNLTETAQQS